VSVWVNESDLRCSVCHDPLYHAVALPCMHRFCEKCVFFLNKCALCRKDIDVDQVPLADHFIQSLSKENIKELPLCGAGPPLLFSENDEHRKHCLTCLNLLCSKQEENLKLLKNRFYSLLSNTEDTDSDDDETENPVIQLRVSRNGR